MNKTDQTSEANVIYAQSDQLSQLMNTNEGPGCDCQEDLRRAVNEPGQK